MGIKRGMNPEEPQDFEDMMKDADQEMEANQTEDEIVERAPQLKQLSESIDNAATRLSDAQTALEAAILKYNQTKDELTKTVNGIGTKVGTINTHIDEVLENAPTKLTVSLKVNAEDWTKMQEMFDKHNAEIEAKMRGHIRSVNQMFEEERKKVRERYREYDGIYLGYYAQWIGEFFFFIGVFVVLTVIIMLVGNSADWFKL